MYLSTAQNEGLVPVGWYKFPAFYSLAAPSHVLHFQRSNGLNENRTRNVLTKTSSPNQPRIHDLAYTTTTKPLVILKKTYTLVGHDWAHVTCFPVTIVSILGRGE